MTVQGYAGDVMEPFVSPEGRVLLFNTRNGPGDHTELRWALRTRDGRYAYRGGVTGTESPALSGVPSLDRARELFFVSPRSYDETLETIYTARFDLGIARDVRAVAGLAAPRRGIVRFDADISGDGRRLLLSEGTFDAAGGPHSASLVLARRTATGFAIDPDSARIFAAVNAGGLNYAGTMTADQRGLFFTRAAPGSAPQIWVARRATPREPFGPPERIENLGEFVEAPTLAEHERVLYYHRRVDGDHFALFAVTAPRS